jgi:hypothetical protein
MDLYTYHARVPGSSTRCLWKLVWLFCWCVAVWVCCVWGWSLTLNISKHEILAYERHTTHKHHQTVTEPNWVIKDASLYNISRFSPQCSLSHWYIDFGCLLMVQPCLQIRARGIIDIKLTTPDQRQTRAKVPTLYLFAIAECPTLVIGYSSLSTRWSNILGGGCIRIRTAPKAM